MKNFPILVLTFLILLLSSFSQTSASDIRGNLILEDGSALPGVLITLIGDVSGEKTIVTSNEGSFKFIGLQPGYYSLKFELEGFNEELQKGIRLFGDKNVKLDFQMKFE